MQQPLIKNIKHFHMLIEDLEISLQSVLLFHWIFLDFLSTFSKRKKGNMNEGLKPEKKKNCRAEVQIIFTLEENIQT